MRPDRSRMVMGLLDPADRKQLEGVTGDTPQSLGGVPGAEGLIDPQTPSAFPLRLWPPPQSDDQWWQQFHNDQLYRGMRREDIPPNFRPPIEIPDTDHPWWMPGRPSLTQLP